MTKIVMQKMAKIVAVSVMSAIVSVSFNGCGFLESVGNQTLSSLSNTAQKGISSLGDTAEKGISNALSTESKSSSGKNDSSKCSGNEIKTDKSVEKGECKGGKRNGVWKYYDNYGYIQQETTFQNGETILEKVYDKDEKLKHTTRYNDKGEVIYKREYENGKLQYFIHFNTYFERKYEVNNWISKHKNEIYEAKERAREIAKQRAESKVKKPTMQDIKKARETGKDATIQYIKNLTAQEEKELQIELSKIPSIPNFDAYSDAQLIAYINSNKIKPDGEIAYNADGNLRVRKEFGGYGLIYFERPYYNHPWAGEVCYLDSRFFSYSGGDDCKILATKYKQAIDNSAFKDEIYNALPKPKNQ